MLLSVESLEKMIAADPTLKVGCIVDTNVIFATTFPLDHHNEWGEQVFQTLHKLEIPIFTNLNVRSEFIDLNRRVLVPEGLVDFYEDFKGTVTGEIEASLKSLKTRLNKATDNNKTLMLNDGEIKNYRSLLETIQKSSEKTAWDLFCDNYFSSYIQRVWDKAVTDLKLNFLGTREIEEKRFFTTHPKWEDMLHIVGQTAIGSSDAMIINLYLKSSIPIMVTADNDVKKTLLKFSPQGKVVLAP